MWVYNNILARSRNVYTSSAILTVWHRITRIQYTYDGLMLPETTKCPYVFYVKCSIRLSHF